MNNRVSSKESKTSSSFDKALESENLKLHRKLVKQEAQIASLKNRIKALEEAFEDAKSQGLQEMLGRIMQRAGPVPPKLGSGDPQKGQT